MNLTIAAAVPAPARPGAGTAAGPGSGVGSGSAGAFQSLLEALAVLPGSRSVPGPAPAVLLGDGVEDPAAQPGAAAPAESAVLPAEGTGPAPVPAGFSYGAGTGAGEVPPPPAPAVPGAAADAGLTPGSGVAAEAVPAAVPVAVPVAVAAAVPAAPPVAAAVPGPRVPAAAPPMRPDSAAAAVLPSAAAVLDPARPAAPAPSFPAAPSFPPAVIRGTAPALRPAPLPVPAAAADAAAHPEGPAGTAATSQIPGVSPAVPPAAQLAGTAAAAPPLPAAAPQLHTQLAKPVFSLLAAGDGEHVMTLKVTPESLGTVTVRAVIGSDGVRLELFAADAGREAVRAVLPDLRRELAGSGFNASLDLGSGSRPDGEPGREQHRTPAGTEAAEAPAAAAARPQDPAPSHPVPDGASALDILA